MQCTIAKHGKKKKLSGLLLSERVPTLSAKYAFILLYPNAQKRQNKNLDAADVSSIYKSTHMMQQNDWIVSLKVEEESMNIYIYEKGALVVVLLSAVEIDVWVFCF